MEYDIYIAGPLFSIAEGEFTYYVQDKLESYGLIVYRPSPVIDNPEKDHPELDAFQKDVEAIIASKMMFAVMDGPDPDSGTSWEVGFAFGINKYLRRMPIVLYRSDFRNASDSKSGVNLMLTESADSIYFDDMNMRGDGFGDLDDLNLAVEKCVERCRR